MSETESVNPLFEYFRNHRGRLIDKWLHYFDVYHRHLARFRGTRCTLVEIGVFHGGSLQMWRDYFGPDARIIGVDINPRTLTLAEPGIEIMIGDQGNPAFLQRLREQVPRIDVLIDDGGHTMRQQMLTFQELFHHVDANGVYLCEDMHTSYWKDYDGGYRHQFSFMEYCKALTDQLNAFHTLDPNSFSPNRFTRSAASMHFYDSVVVIEKQLREGPQRRFSGTPQFGEQLPPGIEHI